MTLSTRSSIGSAGSADRLLATAASLFRRKGYASSSMRELAELVGIRKASLYYHIRSKEEVLAAICRSSLCRIHRAVSAVAAAEPAETRLRRMIVAHVASSMQDQDMHAVMLLELRALSPDRRGEIVARRDAYEALLRDAIVADQGAGRLRRDIDAKLLTLALLNGLNWSIFWFDPADDVAPDELAALLATVFLRGAEPSPNDHPTGRSG